MSPKNAKHATGSERSRMRCLPKFKKPSICSSRKIQAHELSDMCKISVIQATQYLYGSKPYPSRRRLQVKFNKDGSINWGDEYKAAKQARWSRRHVKTCSGYRFNESEAEIQKARRCGLPS